MKVISTIKKRAVIIIGVLAIAILSVLSLSSAYNEARPQSANNPHQTLTSTSISSGSTNTTPTSSAPHTLATTVNDESSSSLTENSTSSDTTQSLTVTSDNSSPVTSAPAPITIPPANVIPSCQPCGIYRPDYTKTDALLCPMVNCPALPVNPPTQPIPSCSPCGVNNQYGVVNPHMCMMIMCAY
jgi:hypothetical protein